MQHFYGEKYIRPIMYTENQYAKHTWQRILRGFAILIALVQTAAFAAAETGQPWLPFGTGLHLLILLLAILLLGLLWRTGLTLRLNADGLAWRYWPWQWRYQQLRWSEIRRLRLLPAGELPPGARFGLPSRDFTRICLLSSPLLPVLWIELVNSTQLYISTEKPTEVLDFLQHGLVGKYVESR